jgi:HlyD family secretion protein
VEEAQARLAQAEKELERSRELAKRDMLSQQELDAAVASRDTLTAQLKVAQAAVEQIKAALRLSRANLDYTTIRSPVNGVVIARNVDEGQTVVASMSAQVLFQIATDLREVQVVASIPEADIGKIRAEQPVTFTVDAYDQDFTGAVQQVRLASATVQNVVTYPVVVRANNPDGRLFPGMTANASFEVARRDGVLKVPNGALRFTPSTAAPKGQPPAAGGANKSHGPKVWIQKTPGAAPEPIAVTLGITDGSFTELKDPVKLREGQEVLVGLAEKGSTDQGTVNPFVPRFPGRRR